jgi:hypothetical protein
MRFRIGSATVPVTFGRRLAGQSPSKSDTFFRGSPGTKRVFGETPKTAVETTALPKAMNRSGLDGRGENLLQRGNKYWIGPVVLARVQHHSNFIQIVPFRSKEIHNRLHGNWSSFTQRIDERAR